MVPYGVCYQRMFMACSSQNEPSMPCREPFTSYDAVTVQLTSDVCILYN